MKKSKLSIAYQAAALVDADHRTALKIMDGRPVRGRVADRIRMALNELGYRPEAPKNA